jgi:hypothetical protein
MKEKWKVIEGFENYEVSNFGRVKSLKRKKERILKFSLDTHGYYILSLYKENKAKTKQVSQLVAIAFLNHKPCGYDLVVDHIDNNPLNNNLDNLQVISNRDNLSKDKKGFSKYTGVSFKKDINKWQSRICINGKSNYLGVFKTELEASNAYKLKLKTLDNGIN